MNKIFTNAAIKAADKKVGKTVSTFIFLYFTLFNTLFLLAQQQEFIFQQWAGSIGTQNFYYKNVTKTDVNGYVYTAGSTLNSNGDYDLLLTKYSKTGVLQWVRQYDGAGHGQDMATNVAIDASGNVYITGTTYVSSTNLNDIITIKYNSSGTQQWLKTYNGSASSYDAGGGILIDGSYVYICGGAMTTSNLGDFVVIKYAVSDGTQQWVNTWNYNGNYDIAYKITTTSLSTVVTVTGGVQYNSTTWKLGVVNFLKTTGAVNGTPSVTGNNSGSMDDLGDVFEDPSQTYTYVAGSINNTGSGTGYDYKIAKLQNSDLTVVWERTWNGANNLDDKASDIAVDGSGNVYVTGYTTTTNQDKNYATVKYNSSGTLQWVKYYNGSGNGRDEGTSICVDDANNIYVTGTSNTGSSQDYYTIKYKPDNTVVWENGYNGLYNGLDKPYDIAVDNATKDVLVSGQTQTASGYTYTMVGYGQATTVFPTTDEALSSSFCFTENLGQLLKTNDNPADNVLFYNFSNNPNIYFTDQNFFSYVLSSIDTIAATNDTLHRVDIGFVSPKHNKFYGLTKRSDYYNFYLGHIPEGRERVTNYSRLFSPEFYNKIDAIYGSNSAGYTMRFVCKSGSTPAASIKLRFTGADSIRVVNNDLIIYTKLGQIKHPRATVYELDNNGTKYTLGWQPTYVRSGNDITFTLGSYNTARNLVIQMGFTSTTASPTDVDWSTYLGAEGHVPGAGGQDIGYDVEVDVAGNSYVAGSANSNVFPVVSGAFQGIIIASDDFFIASFNDYATPRWRTFYGGNLNDIPLGIDLTAGSVYIVGRSASINFPIQPLPNPGNGVYYQTGKRGTWDAVIVRLKTGDGSALWSTYFGGSAGESALGVATDGNGNIFVVGQTSTWISGNSTTCEVPANSGFPLCNPGGDTYYQGVYGGFDSLSISSDVFISRFNNLNQLTWSTYFGGSGEDVGLDILADASNNVYITGYTTSTNNAVCTTPDSTEFPLCNSISGAYFDSTHNGGSDAFIAKFNISLALTWSTYIGGNTSDKGVSLALNSNDNIYLSGYTTSTPDAVQNCNVPALGGFPLCDNGGYFQDTVAGLTDVFIMKFQNGQMKWSTYLGGSGNEGGNSFIHPFGSNAVAVVCDQDNNLYLTGSTENTTANPTGDFPVQELAGVYYNGSHTTGNVSTDAFIAKFSPSNAQIWTTYYGGSNAGITSGSYAGGDWGNGIAVYENRKIYVTGGTQTFDFPLTCPDAPTGETPYCQGVPATRTYDAFIMRMTDSVLYIGINEHQLLNENGLSVYPNPSTNTITIEFLSESANDNVILSIYDLSGRLVYSDKMTVAKGKIVKQINVENLSSSVYFINLSSEHMNRTLKLIKN